MGNTTQVALLCLLTVFIRITVTSSVSYDDVEPIFIRSLYGNSSSSDYKLIFHQPRYDDSSFLYTHMNSSALWKSSGKVLKMKEGYLFMLILLNSWDLQLNPGPYRGARKVKYPCGICTNNVSWNTSGVRCDQCHVGLWFHQDCMNMPTCVYEGLTNISWYCSRAYLWLTELQHIPIFELVN